MNRILICIAALAAASGAAQASTVIACNTGAMDASNSCFTSHLATFSDQLLWSGLSTSASSFSASPFGPGEYNATWYDSADGANFQVVGSSLIQADNYTLAMTGAGWQNIGHFGPYSFSGNFDSAPDTGVTTSGVGLVLNSYGEQLLGSFNAGSFLVKSDTALSSFGFRIAAITSAAFDVTITLFDGNGNQIGSPLIESGLTGGGNCATLGQNPPVPCNTAPFLYVSTTGNVASFSIATSDPTGFYMDGLDFNTDVPEPASLAITSGGLLTLAYFIRRKRAAARA